MPLKQVYSRGRRVDSHVMAKPRVNFYADARENHEMGLIKFHEAKCEAKPSRVSRARNHNLFATRRRKFPFTRHRRYPRRRQRRSDGGILSRAQILIADDRFYCAYIMRLAFSFSSQSVVPFFNPGVVTLF